MYNIYCKDCMSDEAYIHKSFFHFTKAEAETTRLNILEQQMERSCAQSGEDYYDKWFFILEEKFGKHPEDALFKAELSLVPLSKGYMLLIDPENHYADGFEFETERQAYEWAASMGFKVI